MYSTLVESDLLCHVQFARAALFAQNKNYVVPVTTDDYFSARVIIIYTILLVCYICCVLYCNTLHAQLLEAERDAFPASIALFLVPFAYRHKSEQHI